MKIIAFADSTLRTTSRKIMTNEKKPLPEYCFQKIFMNYRMNYERRYFDFSFEKYQFFLFNWNS